MSGDIHLDTLLRVIGICTHVHCILLTRVMYMFTRALLIAYTCNVYVYTWICIMLTRVMCYATTVCSTRVVRVGLCVRIFGRGFLPMYESREVSTGRSLASLRVMNKKTY